MIFFAGYLSTSGWIGCRNSKGASSTQNRAYLFLHSYSPYFMWLVQRSSKKRSPNISKQIKSMIRRPSTETLSWGLLTL